MPRRRKGRDLSKLRGAARMREFGYKRIEVWADQAELVILLNAARTVGKPLAEYLRWAAVRWAKDYAHDQGKIDALRPRGRSEL